MKKTRLCDVKWDSGNKPEIDNTYFVYNCGNDGLYHLALAAEVTCSAQLFLSLSVRMHQRVCVLSGVCCVIMHDVFAVTIVCPSHSCKDS